LREDAGQRAEPEEGVTMRDGATALASGQSETTIEVALPERSYPVIIGENLIASAGRRITAAVPDARCAVVSDRNVAALYLTPLKASLDQHGLFLGEAVVSPGEASKSFSVLAPLCESLLALGVERGDCIISLGGGVVGDLAGFAGSILRRGVRVVQMPTSLLAQVDSAIGGKTGIDTRLGKNLIGTFHQPSLVLADISVLSTLSPREFRAGYAEVVKYGLLGDAAFFAWLEQDSAEVFSGQGGKRRYAVETSARAKAKIVQEDERETSGTRALLNLGHTFGHALEAYAGYSDRLLHGEAIAIGMRLAFTFSVELGLCPKDDAERVERHLAAIGLPTKIAAVPGAKPTPEELLRLMAQDKKVKGSKLALVLVHGIGAAFVEREVRLSRLTEFLAEECNRR
jgi:3-dehydroquinate synthase